MVKVRIETSENNLDDLIVDCEKIVFLIFLIFFVSILDFSNNFAVLAGRVITMQ